MRLQPVLTGNYPILADLGSGFGYYADTLREHAGYLVGLDLFLPSLHVAKSKKIFDDLIRADILHLPLRPERIDCATLFDVIEHFSKNEGKELLASLESSVFVSTPNSGLSNKYYARLVGNVLERHVSTWSTRDFEDLGYKASIRTPPLWMFLLRNKGILFAWRLRSNRTSEHAVEQDCDNLREDRDSQFRQHYCVQRLGASE